MNHNKNTMPNNNERTLRQLGEEAEKNYAHYTDKYNRARYHGVELRGLNRDIGELELTYDALAKEIGGRGKSLLHPVKGQQLKEIEGRINHKKVNLGIQNENAVEADQHLAEAVKAGKDFYEENAGDLHDLGVIEARLDGVEIKVEQPQDQSK